MKDPISKPALTIDEVKEAARLSARLGEMEREQHSLSTRLINLRERCPHDKLPKRKGGEEYRDSCPDCGFTAYGHWL